MPIRDCTILAVEGTQAAGKTTLVHALTAHYRERGVHVGCTLEAARLSPFAARNYSLLITDKTVMNVTAYARLVLAFATPGLIPG